MKRIPHDRAKRRIFVRSLFMARSASLGLAIIIAVLASRPANAVPPVVVEEGKSIVLKYGEKIETVSLANDKIADVVAITADELVVIGKLPGTTSLVVWGKSLAHTIYELKVVRNFSGRQVILAVQIGEVNKNAFDNLGFDILWQNSDLTEGLMEVGSYAGAVRTPSIPLTVGEGVSGLFHFLGRQNDVAAIVEALQERGDLKLLATPKLISLSGQKASFLSGGEIPVPISQSSVGNTQTITVEWKEYGVRLNFVPTVVDSDLISLYLEPEVSSLDFTNAVVIGGFAIPSLRTRRAKTTVELHSDEAMYLGGLVSNERFMSRRRIPILGHIPLIGAFFTRKEVSSRETELVIIVSPRIIEDVNAEPVPPLPWNGPEEKVRDSTGGAVQPGPSENIKAKSETDTIEKTEPAKDSKENPLPEG
jgi:pilus assembly protein CpaC